MVKPSRKAFHTEVTPRQQEVFSRPSQKLFPEASLSPDSFGGVATFRVHLRLARNRAMAGEGCSSSSGKQLWVHGAGGRGGKDAGVAGSSAGSFTFLSLLQKKNICKLLLLLSLANHSPLKTSLCRFPELLVCGFYRCNLVSGSWFNLSISLTCPASSHKGGHLGPLVTLCLCVLQKLLCRSGELPQGCSWAGETGLQPFGSVLTVAVMTEGLARA